MSKKVLIVQGGGRPHGNTEQLVKSFEKGLQDAGHETIYINLNQKKVNGCLGCNLCRYEKPCIQKDDFNEIADLIRSADLIAFASPLLFWTISSKLKAFLERFYCIAQKDDNPPYGRYEKYPVNDCCLLMTSADNYFWTYSQAVSYYNFNMINYLGFQDKGMLLAGGCGSSNGKPNIQNTDWLDKAYEFGLHIYD